MPTKTPEQHFRDLFNVANDEAASPTERDKAEKAMAAWLKRHGKTRRDIGAILLQAEKDDPRANSPPPSPDPRDAAPHPFDDPMFTPADLVEGILQKYVTMDEHVRVIYVLAIILTHVHERFSIAPRIALTSKQPDAGKSTALEIVRDLVRRPNKESIGTGAAIRDHFISGVPGCVLLDEFDHLEKSARNKLYEIWDLGHRKHGAKISLKVNGQKVLVDVYGLIFAAGIRGLRLPPQLLSRTLMLEMEPYSEGTKPPRNYWVNYAVEESNQIYSYIHSWAVSVRLNPDPPIPELIRRHADNVRGLLSIADACGREWGRRAREVALFLFAKEQAERPQITMLRHGIVIFDTLGVDQINTVQFNQELKRLALPDARWTRYRGPSGGEYEHPLAMYEQAELLALVDIHSMSCWPPGPREPGGGFRGYKRAQFEEALRQHTPPSADRPGRGRLRLITPSESDPSD